MSARTSVGGVQSRLQTRVAHQVHHGKICGLGQVAPDGGQPVVESLNACRGTVESVCVDRVPSTCYNGSNNHAAGGPPASPQRRDMQRGRSGRPGARASDAGVAADASAPRRGRVALPHGDRPSLRALGVLSFPLAASGSVPDHPPTTSRWGGQEHRKRKDKRGIGIGGVGGRRDEDGEMEFGIGDGEEVQEGESDER